jgi:hypothetical protein
LGGSRELGAEEFEVFTSFERKLGAMSGEEEEEESGANTCMLRSFSTASKSTMGGTVSTEVNMFEVSLDVPFQKHCDC